jgi:peptide/nickel transport system permease protein
VWAPLLATPSPLHFRGYDKGAVGEAGRLARLELEDVAGALAAGGGSWTRAKVGTSFDVVDFQLERMGGSLKDDLAAKVEALRASAAGLRREWERRNPGAADGPVPADPAAATALAPLVVELKDGLHPSEGDLVPRTRWPAFRALDALDVLFLAASILFPVGCLWLRGGKGRRRRPGMAAAVVLWPSLAAALLALLLAPAREDLTDFKRGLEERTIVAESVTFAPVPFGINENAVERKFEKPFLAGSGHALGTDENGRDMLCRLLWGARVSLSVGFVAVGIYVFIGVVVGAVAGVFGGWTDIVISRVIEWVICFPVFILVLVIAAFLQGRTFWGFDPPQLVVIMVILGVTGWPGVARLVRAEFLRMVGQDFVQAARALGAGRRRLMFGHLLPNAMAPVLVAATFGVAGAILTESALSFLGLGISVPRPSWGGMLNAAHGYEQTSVWIFLWPGLAIFMVITCYNLVGEALRDALDPRLRQ